MRLTEKKKPKKSKHVPFKAYLHSFPLAQLLS